MIHPKEVLVTEQIIDISNLTELHWTYYKKLASSLHSIYLEKGSGRKIFSLGGVSGTGKSVVVELLRLICAEYYPEMNVTTVGIDGFHYSNDYLIKHDLKSKKGHFDTYDTDLLFKKLTAFKNGELVRLPLYSRKLHEPIPDKITVSEDNVLLLLEGLWLYYKNPAWERVRGLFDFTLEVAGPEEELKANVIQRHIRGGRTVADAEDFYSLSDQINNQLLLTNSHKADAKIFFYTEIGLA